MRLKIGFALLLAGTGCAPALAQGTVLETASYRIGYADLDIGTRVGMERLDRRIRSAVALACGDASDADPRGQNRIRRCRTEARVRATLQRDRAFAGTAGVPALIAAKR